MTSLPASKQNYIRKSAIWGSALLLFYVTYLTVPPVHDVVLLALGSLGLFIYYAFILMVLGFGPAAVVVIALLSLVLMLFRPRSSRKRTA